MFLSPEIKECIDKSVLCWLATSSEENIPNVSPKEMFTHYQDEFIIVANIASPQTVKNIKQNPNVCISFIEILVQKGFQLKGKGSIIGKEHPDFSPMQAIFLEMTGGKFPFASITKIEVNKVRPIIAPRYLLYPETTEEQQVAAAKKQYNLL